jgi:hypothetical protein
MDNPLVPGLYELLRQEFGDVGIANEGESAGDIHPRWDPVTGRLEWDLDNGGEYYKVSCPYCLDGRQRLWFHHLYGQLDEVTGDTANWLVVCYNEGCLQGSDRRARDNREDLEIRLFRRMGSHNRNVHLTVLPGKPADDGPPAPAYLPGEIVYLDDLPARHPAVAYMTHRGYDPVKLGIKYEVGVCTRSMDYPQARGRIIIPIIMDETLVGWQGRYIGDLDWKEANVRKYYNLPGMKRRKLLYNWDRFRRSRILVLVEGVTGVWAVGDAGAALLGKTISAPQKVLIHHLLTHDDRPRLLVLMLDPDVDNDYRSAQKLAMVFSDMRATFEKRGGAAFRVQLPPGTDPGDYAHDAIWERIYAAGDAHGVDVTAFLDQAPPESTPIG